MWCHVLFCHFPKYFIFHVLKGWRMIVHVLWRSEAVRVVPGLGPCNRLWLVQGLRPRHNPAFLVYNAHAILHTCILPRNNVQLSAIVFYHEISPQIMNYNCAEQSIMPLLLPIHIDLLTTPSLQHANTFRLHHFPIKRHGVTHEYSKFQWNINPNISSFIPEKYSVCKLAAFCPSICRCQPYHNPNVSKRINRLLMDPDDYY